MFVRYNRNPKNKTIGDCTVRAISTILKEDWEDTYLKLCLIGYEQKDMPSSNSVWGMYLHDKGFIRVALPNTCPYCYTVKDFTKDHPNGNYILALPSHVVAIIDGDYLDSWDCGDETPIYFWKKG